MKLVALETSTEYCSVALWHDGVVSERFELAGQRHSELLIPMLDDVLQQAGCQLREVDGIAFGKGPGSFTGIRIAAGVAQGLALGAGLNIVGIVTLEALAQLSGHDKVIAALDARMGEIYHAVYEKRDGLWMTVVAPNLCKAEDAPRITGEGWFGCGSGFAVQEHALTQRYSENLCGADGRLVPRACAVAQLAAPVFAAGEGVDAAQALPLYLRDKVALTTRERELAKHSA